MGIRLLGPVEVFAGPRRVEVGPARQRMVTAALAAEVGRLVPTDVLVDRVWGEAPPERARRTLQTYLCRLRRLLEQVSAAGEGPAQVLCRGGGYVLEADPELVDLHRFRGLVERARGAGPERLAVLRSAVRMWRGEPLAGLTGDWAGWLRHAWSLERMEAVVAWAEAELRAGNAAAVVGPVTELAGGYPLVESLTAVRMRALATLGRTAEALACYAGIRRRLAEELGVDPGIELQDLHREVLCGGWGRPGDPAPAATGPAVPAQLPTAVPAFTGRTGELADLAAVLPREGGTGDHVPIATVAGIAGVGKTTLAVWWAHRIADRFPDGQLFVDLRGFGPGEPAAAADALAGVLRALGVAGDRVPVEVAEAAALYRSLLAGRRVLVLLDNARDPDQARPLLPGSPGCLVIVTSRNDLSSLVAVEGARPVTLPPLSAAESRELLARRVGADRVAAEPDAVRRIVEFCGRLPLALAIVAARAAARPAFSLTALAAQLGQAHTALDALRGEDCATDVRTVFSWSHRGLPEPAARLFRLLAVHTGPDIGEAAVASLLGVAPELARPALAELTRGHLLTERSPGRYALHDLLRAYAADLLARQNPGERSAALRRVLDHYLHTAHAAATLLRGYRDPPDLPPAVAGVTPEAVPDHDSAFGWFGRERPALLAAVGQAARTGPGGHAWRLAWTLVDYLHRQGHWHDQVSCQETALRATLRCQDLTGESHARRGLARAYLRMSRQQAAVGHLRRALDIASGLADRSGQAEAHRGLAYALGLQGEHDAALAHAREAYELCRGVGNLHRHADALNGLGWCHAQLGRYQEALECCEQALVLFRIAGDQRDQAETWDSLGYAHHHLGHHERALGCYRHALALFQVAGDRYQEADTLNHIGDTRHAAGQPDAARHAWQRALTILTDLDHPDARQVAGKLAGLARTG